MKAIEGARCSSSYYTWLSCTHVAFHRAMGTFWNTYELHRDECEHGLGTREHSRKHINAWVPRDKISIHTQSGGRLSTFRTVKTHAGT